MKFIHVSDTHLGAEIPVEYKEIRKKDFIYAFSQVVDFAIKNKVDFIIHSGDLLDDFFRINSSVLSDIIDLLLKLKKNNIPFIVIRGNHDNKGHRQNFFNLLKKLELLIEPSIKEPIIIKDAFIYGISEPENISGEVLRNFYKTILQKIKIDKSGYSIFMFHGVPDIFYSNPTEPRILPISFFPDNIDYYAFGHFHLPKLHKENDKIFALPGSTERTVLSTEEEYVNKGFYLVVDNNVKFVPIKTRKIRIIKKQVKEEEDMDSITSILSEGSKETIYKVSILYKRTLYPYIRKKLDAFKRAGYMIVEDLEAEDFEMKIVEEEIEEEVLESVINRLFIKDKEVIKTIFYKIKEVIDDYYSEGKVDTDKARETIKIKLLEWL